MAGDDPQSDLVSTETFHIAGIPIHVYGLTELKASIPVDCLWLLHRRNGDYTQMTSFANRVIKAWISNPLSSTRGLIAIAFDHRNHGARLVDPVANKGWRKNTRHAADMYSIYHGTAADVSLLIDYIEPCIFPGSDQGRLGTHMVLGASLGGHSAWHCALWESRIKDVVSVIGCPDYMELMRGRALSANMIGQSDDLVGTPAFPTSLYQAVQRTDPMCQLDADRGSSSPGKVKEALDGKRVLCLSGGQDTLVPHSKGQRFRVEFRPDGKLGNIQMQFRDLVDDEADHVFTEKMEACAANFIIECVESRAEGLEWVDGAPVGLISEHI